MHRTVDPVKVHPQPGAPGHHLVQPPELTPGPPPTSPAAIRMSARNANRRRATSPNTASGAWSDGEAVGSDAAAVARQRPGAVWQTGRTDTPKPTARASATLRPGTGAPDRPPARQAAAGEGTLVADLVAARAAAHEP